MKQRRCLRREFRLRPDRLVVQIYLYALAYAANKHGIVLSEFVALGNHDHLVFTDPRAERPAFLQLFHSLVGPDHPRSTPHGSGSSRIIRALVRIIPAMTVRGADEIEFVADLKVSNARLKHEGVWPELFRKSCWGQTSSSRLVRSPYRTRSAAR
jgi:hypothetical protein